MFYSHCFDLILENDPTKSTERASSLQREKKNIEETENKARVTKIPILNSEVWHMKVFFCRCVRWQRSTRGGYPSSPVWCAATTIASKSKLSCKMHCGQTLDTLPIVLVQWPKCVSRARDATAIEMVGLRMESRKIERDIRRTLYFISCFGVWHATQRFTIHQILTYGRIAIKTI